MAITETRTRPAQFIEDIGKNLAQNLVASTAVPTVSVGLSAISQRPGESAADFAARQTAARAFETRQQSLAGLAPSVAPQDALQKQAASLAASGVGSFQPFINQAQQLTGAGGGTGAGSIQEFMSPYQTQVIDASLAEFDRNAAANRQRIRDQAVASGAFGGGREGVELAEFQTGSDMDRAMLQANLLQQGFESAAARRQQDLANQQGLAQLLPQLQRSDISTLGSVGAVQQAQEQAERDATREAARQATFLPQENLSRYAGQVAGLMGGYPGQTTQSFVPNPSPLQTAIGAGSALAGIFGALRG
jgi:hypothetical protein|tara:strand:+ start:251 stop:1165 length:915 start_codon:yes stop_codon:yes gene_type:complete